MISYSEFKTILKEADEPAKPAASADASAAPPADAASLPPDSASMSSMPSGGGMPSGMPDMPSGPQVGSASGMKPEGIKSSNVWDALDKFLFQ